MKESHLSDYAHIIVTERHMKESHPSGAVRIEFAVLVGYGRAFVQEEERLREAQQHDSVDDGKREHVSGYHFVNHHHERTCELESSFGIITVLITLRYFKINTNSVR